MPLHRTSRVHGCMPSHRHHAEELARRHGFNETGAIERPAIPGPATSTPDEGRHQMRPRETSRYRGGGIPEPFSAQNLSLQFSVVENATDQNIAILTDHRYRGIPIVSRSFVEKGGLNIWEGPPVTVEMMNGNTFSFRKYALLSAVYQCRGYYGKVVIAEDRAAFYAINGWMKEQTRVVPDLVFSDSFLKAENLNRLN